MLALLCASLAQAQDQSQREHVPPDPPQIHVHDMSYREMVEMMGMDDRRRFGKVMLDRLEWQDADDGSRYAWDARCLVRRRLPQDLAAGRGRSRRGCDS